MRSSAAEGRPFEQEYRVVWPDGSTHWLASRGIPQNTRNGKYTRMLGILMDITARKRAEEALRESEEKYRSLIEASNSIIMRADKDLNITYMNPFGLEFFGYTAAELIGRHVIGTTIPEKDDAGRDLAAMVRDIPRHPARYKTNIHQNMRKGGELVWVSWANNVKHDADGNVVEILAIGSDISQIKEAEAALRRGEERFRLLSETASRLLTAEQPQTAVNDLCRQVMEHLDCQMFFNFLVDDAAGRLHLNACAGIPKREAKKLEWLDYGASVCGCVARDGQRIVVEDIPNAHDPRTDLVASYGVKAYACHPLMAQGRVMGTLSFGAKTRTRFSAEDVSLMKLVADQVAAALDRIHSQQALTGSEQDLRLALDGGGMGRWEWDLQRKVSRWCERTYDLLGLPAVRQDESRTFLDVVDPQDRPLLKQQIEKATSDGPNFQAEFRTRRPDGQTPWLTLRGKVIRDPRGRAVRMMGVVFDISHRKHLEADLRRLNERLEQQVEQRTEALAQTIDQLETEVRRRVLMEKELQRRSQMLEGFFQHTITPLAFMDKKFNFIRVNEAYARADKRRPEEFIGRNHFELYPNKENQRVFKDVVRTKEPYHAYSRAFSFPQESRRNMYWNWLLTPLLDEEGEVQSLVLNLEDVTDRQRAFEELERRASQLQRLTLELSQAEDRERQRLARILHDDLQQLLVGAKFHINTLTRRVKDNEEVKEMLAQVYRLVSESIDKSRSLSHELTPPLLFQAALGEALAWLGRQMHQTCGLTVEVDVAAGIDLNSDALKSFMYKAAQELLFNVVKHAQVKQARMQLRRLKGYVRLIVSDEGRGFDPDQLAKAGGFGLFSIQERARLLGGWMKFKSTPGAGSVFILAMPDTQKAESARQKTVAAPQRTPEAAPHSEASAFSDAPAVGHPLRIMLVDDHKVMREGVATMLDEQPDMEVVGQAGNGRDAVAMAKQLRPDVIVMDVAMPIMDGEEATRRIKSHLPLTRIIGLSLSEEAAVSQKMERAGAERYVSKADPSEALLAAIRNQPTS